MSNEFVTPYLLRNTQYQAPLQKSKCVLQTAARTVPTCTVNVQQVYISTEPNSTEQSLYLFVVYLMALSVAQTTQGRMTSN
jgi:hypothetical protein